MKVSARNVLPGTVVDVTKGVTTTVVGIDVGGMVVTATITNQAADELQLQPGKKAYAIVKASDVIVGTD